ncbi:MAG: carbon storage regulator CsrA [Planctomycetaceae bacterium]|nr:carbon storage regulator CsrA [Planctomycetaceae bacterium]
MLVLERLPGETVYVGDDVKVTVTKVRGNKVWIGFDAPRSLPIHRGEVYDRMRQERRTNEDGERL